MSEQKNFRQLAFDFTYINPEFVTQGVNPFQTVHKNFEYRFSPNSESQTGYQDKATDPNIPPNIVTTSARFQYTSQTNFNLTPSSGQSFYVPLKYIRVSITVPSYTQVTLYRVNYDFEDKLDTITNNTNASKVYSFDYVLVAPDMKIRFYLTNLYDSNITTSTQLVESNGYELTAAGRLCSAGSYYKIESGNRSIMYSTYDEEWCWTRSVQNTPKYCEALDSVTVSQTFDSSIEVGELNYTISRQQYLPLQFFHTIEIEYRKYNMSFTNPNYIPINKWNYPKVGGATPYSIPITTRAALPEYQSDEDFHYQEWTTVLNDAVPSYPPI